MKNFGEWLNESEFAPAVKFILNEGAFKTHDIVKHKYLQQLIASVTTTGALLDKDTSAADGETAQVKIIISNKKTVKELDDLSKYVANIPEAKRNATELVDKFNAIVKTWSTTADAKAQYDNIAKAFEINPSKAASYITFTHFDKLQFSGVGKTTKGEISYKNSDELTKIQESMQGYAIELFAAGDSIEDIQQKLTEIFIADGKLKSSVDFGFGRGFSVDQKIPLNIITDYIKMTKNACNGWSQIKSKYKIRGKVRFSQPSCEKDPENVINYFINQAKTHFLNGANENTWSTMDIVMSTIKLSAIRKREEEILNGVDMKDTVSVRAAYNHLISELLEEGKVIPISLKLPEFIKDDYSTEVHFPQAESETNAHISVKSFSYQPGTERNGLAINAYAFLEIPNEGGEGSHVESFTYVFRDDSSHKVSIIELSPNASKKEINRLAADATNVFVKQMKNANAGGRLGKAKSAFNLCIKGLETLEDKNTIIKMLRSASPKTDFMKKFLKQLLADKTLLNSDVQDGEVVFIRDAVLRLFLKYIYLIVATTKTPEEEEDLVVYMMKAAKKENYKKMSLYAPFIKIA